MTTLLSIARMKMTINHNLCNGKAATIALALLGATALFTACNDYLEEKPKSFIGPDQVADSNAGCDQWVTGVYSNWLDDMFRWGAFPKILEMDADYISGPDWLFGAMGAGNFQGETYAMPHLWDGLYNIINDANVAERHIAAMKSIDADYRDNAIGEMEFQEAFCYFLLVRAYGPIPYMATDVSDGEAPDGGRRPVAEIYGHIIDLLSDAAGKMYTRDNKNYKAGHVSAGSAAGLLAKVYATMASAAMPAGTELTVKTGQPYEMIGDKQVYRQASAETFQKTAVAGYESMDAKALYTEAARWAKKVIDGEYGPYELSTYDNLWARGHRTDSEMMFGVESVTGDTKYCTQIHEFYAGYTDGTSDYIQSGGWMGCSNNWYQLFDDTDLRALKGVRHIWRYYYQASFNGAFYYPQSWSSKVTGYDELGNKTGGQEKQYADMGYSFCYNQTSECLAFTTKYSDVDNNSTKYAESFWPFLRYADVLLIYAEAENELGNQTEAMAYLNKVRARSNATLMTTTPSQTTMRSVILEERAKELACEGDRRWDLIRWGIYLPAMNAIGQDDAGVVKKRTERNLLFPLPQSEINTNDSINENNPGWN